MKASLMDLKNTPSKPTVMRKLYTPHSKSFTGYDGFAELQAKASPPGIFHPKPLVYHESPAGEEFGRKLFSPMANKPIGKGCNCKKSNCLKLYCDCFASGEYCSNCNCTGCYNNEVNERSRKEAIRSILDRNPNAFRPKIAPGPPTPASPMGEDVQAGHHNKVFTLYVAHKNRAVHAKDQAA